ncbi:unnamed protein product [Gongylonema pulchrum]|uniref:Neur_chan_LBD domain-containing protein n=1 Tax=Gongylonema pulchrum TaxID=637853 RepID=A0A183D218_9BILA|nr:unnamed protein product [Gongylonema pulchrum]
MNVPYDLSAYFPDMPIQRLDSVTLRRLNPRKCWIVEKTINSMGTLSATVSFDYWIIYQD